jgi:3-oxoacyl-[acyl-carrier-protein] synthase-3
MQAALKAIDFYLPEGMLTNQDLADEASGWTPEKIAEKTGISSRHIAGDQQCASDLGVEAANLLFKRGKYTPSEFDGLIFCTQSPDFFLPTSACIMQDRLGVPGSSLSFDFNLGCSGYVCGLGLAKGLIESGQRRRILLITADTYSKFIHPGDRSVRTIFGDAGAATVVEAVETDGPDVPPLIGPFVYGTDGRGAPNLIVPAGCMRQRPDDTTGIEQPDEFGNVRTQGNLFMNGPEIFNFAIKEIPRAIHELLSTSSMTQGDVDLFVFHQANRYMLEHLRKKMGIPPEKFVIELGDCGNTVSSTIPIALRRAELSGRLHAGMRIMLVGYGAGYSWAAAMIRWAACS